MKKGKLKILILDPNSWRHDSPGGNVIDNIFGGFDAKFAQVFYEDLLPENMRCEYFHISMHEALRNFFKRKPVGKILNIQNQNIGFLQNQMEMKNKKFDFFRLHRSSIFAFGKKILFKFSIWKTKELHRFILDFNPDIIFAPCYASPFLLELTRYTKNLTNVKVITYLGDDYYSLRQFSLSPIYWIDRFWTRYSLRKTFPYYDYIYSMSEDQINELEPVVKKTIKILRKGIDIEKIKSHENLHHPLKLIYAGNLLGNRWKILAAIGEVLKRINDDQKKIVLNIYTQTVLSKQQKRMLNDEKNLYLHSAVSKSELENLYYDSDVAIHCESFDLKDKLATRLSFSTKIVDCLQSGCAILAIAWSEQTGFKYLKTNDAAFCVSDINMLENTIKYIVGHPDKIKYYAHQAVILAREKHDIVKIRENILKDILD